MLNDKENLQRTLFRLEQGKDTHTNVYSAKYCFVFLFFL